MAEKNDNFKMNFKDEINCSQKVMVVGTRTEIELMIDHNVQIISERCREYGESLKLKMKKLREGKVAEENINNQKFIFENSDLKNLNVSYLVGSLKMNEAQFSNNVIGKIDSIETESQTIIKADLKEPPQNESLKFCGGIENDRNCKVTLYTGDLTNMCSDYCLFFIDHSGRNPKKNPFLDYIVVKARVDEKKMKYLTTETETAPIVLDGGRLRCKSLIFVPLIFKKLYTPEFHVELVALLNQQLEILFSHFKINSQPTVSISIPTNGFVFLFGNKNLFVTCLYKSLMVNLSTRREFATELNFVFPDDNDLNLITPLMNASVEGHIDNLGASLTSGTYLELYAGSLFDLRVDAKLVIFDQNFSPETTVLGKQILKILGNSFTTQLNSLKTKLKINNIIYIRGDKLKCKFIFCCRTIYSEEKSEKERCIDGCLKEALALMKKMGLKSLAMPLLGSGNYGLEMEKSVEILLNNFQTDDFGKVVVAVPMDRQIVEMFEVGCRSKSIWFYQKDRLMSKDDKKEEEESMDTSECTSRETNLRDFETNVIDKVIANNDDENEKSFQSLEKDDSRNKKKDESKAESNTTTASETKINKANVARYHWYYVENGKNIRYPDAINKMLERNYINEASCSRWSESGKIFIVKYAEMMEFVENADKEETAIKVLRIPVRVLDLCIPSHSF
ncbi:hypothetical protein HELRODRAFT_166552 [Helobdella robusta]|uniref:Macro domain-containing protein n=1 Tax=Helobdella robusta TaxID=6412 RepID=T1EY86_HELRO|nr:hypothetical protein HELRODRAFT_166552 [Helobdella robusta]ESO11551.1 hypothetical protein HELRODRAFT_166552 [Helobdella robusta]